MTSKMKVFATIVGVVLGFISSQSGAFESHKISKSPERYSLLFEGGTAEGDAEAERYGGAFRLNFDKPLLRSDNWDGLAYVELSVSYWDGEAGRTNTDSLVDFGLTPVFRLQRRMTNFAPFAEIGVGAHLHTEDGIGDENFDIPFTFGSHFGLGFRFGSTGEYEFVYRFQHLSNASLGDNNPGINFHVIQFGFHF